MLAPNDGLPNGIIAYRGISGRGWVRRANIPEPKQKDWWVRFKDTDDFTQSGVRNGVVSGFELHDEA